MLNVNIIYTIYYCFTLIINLNFNWTRYFLVFILQSLLVFTFIFFAYKVLKRKINKSTLYLAIFFLIESGAGIINIIYIGLEFNYLVVFLFHLSYFIFFFGLFFFLLFLLSFFEEEFNITFKKLTIIAAIYIISIILILNFPGGISFKINETWRPNWNWTFLFVLYIFITIFYTIPILFFSYRLFKYIQFESFRERVKFFLIGTCLLIFQMYGLVLYNTWNNEIYRIFWFFFSILNIASPIFLYLGVGKDI